MFDSVGNIDTIYEIELGEAYPIVLVRDTMIYCTMQVYLVMVVSQPTPPSWHHADQGQFLSVWGPWEVGVCLHCIYDSENGVFCLVQTKCNIWLVTGHWDLHRGLCGNCVLHSSKCEIVPE